MQVHKQKDKTIVNMHWTELKAQFIKFADSRSWDSQPAMKTLWPGTWNNAEWCGGTIEDTLGWLRDGYYAEDFHHTIGQEHNIQTTAIVWNEEEGDPDVTRMICGYDDIFLGALQAPSLSGIKVIFDVTFNCQVPAKMMREYGAFVASATNSLMESGFDLEIDVRAGNHNLCSRDGKSDTMIRVKEFGELMDFTDFSAIFAPTSARHLIFTAWGMYADATKQRAIRSLGHARSAGWAVRWDEENRVLEFLCNPNASKFPGGEMYQQAIEAGIM